MARQIKVTPNSTLNLHSDHHPQLFGKTLIWNLDKENGPTKTGKNLTQGLEMEAFAIAQKINEGKIDSGMLQEMPHGEQHKFIAAIEKYLDPKQKLEMSYAQNGEHEFGNLTFSCQNSATPGASSTEDIQLKAAVSKLQQKYDSDPATRGQVLFSVGVGPDGKKQLLANIHAESDKADYKKKNGVQIKRLNLEEVMNDVNTVSKKHQIGFVVGGDMNAGTQKLPSDLGVAANHPDFRYQHSDKSAFKKDGTPIAVDAVISTDKKTPLKTLADMNNCNKDFVEKFDAEKKRIEKSSQELSTTSEAQLSSNIAASKDFNNAKLQTGHYPLSPRKNESANYTTKLTFQDANQARQFTNLVMINDRRNLFQNEKDVYLTTDALSKITAVNLSISKLSPPPKLSSEGLIDLQKACREKAQLFTDAQVKLPSVSYQQTSIRQDTRGVVDYSMQLTFSSREEARAFSDAMGYKNKTKLFQQGTKVYIAKDIEADFLSKVSKKENTADFKARFKQTTHQETNTKNEKEQVNVHPSIKANQP
ncbi:hypothetical protein A8135_08475 [Legionella jamestowniensis]|uniref:Uncharacterized protein n=1 Tax=Legionella jamestowniensis TaxID=455 RepID=A0ABX2XZK2_9GAMM|nr:hypothetical protein [Legionella jamestowniensis]OCH99269.1 hypothetical protein A8135_08475 [Legionella jamestowniensis]